MISEIVDLIMPQVSKVNEVGEINDGYHSFNELYYYRMLYNALFVKELANSKNMQSVCKSRRHSDGEKCFGGGWFVVVVQLPTGQVTNHYEEKYWDLFKCRAVDKAPKWDGHTPEIAAERMMKFLKEYF